MNYDPLRAIKIGVALMALGLLFVLMNMGLGKLQDYIKNK